MHTIKFISCDIFAAQFLFSNVQLKWYNIWWRSKSPDTYTRNSMLDFGFGLWPFLFVSVFRSKWGEWQTKFFEDDAKCSSYLHSHNLKYCIYYLYMYFCRLATLLCRFDKKNFLMTLRKFRLYVLLLLLLFGLTS